MKLMKNQWKPMKINEKLKTTIEKQIKNNKNQQHRLENRSRPRPPPPSRTGPY